MRAESSEEKIKSKRKEEGGHNGPKANTREIDRPVGGSEHKGSEESEATPVEEFLSEEVYPEYGEGAKEDGGKLEPGYRISEERNKQGLNINEQSFSAKVGRIEEIEVTGFNSMDRVDAVGCFIRVESDWNVFNLIDPNKEGEGQNTKEGDSAYRKDSSFFFHKIDGTGFMHRLFFLFSCLYGKIIAKFIAKEKLFLWARNLALLVVLLMW